MWLTRSHSQSIKGQLSKSLIIGAVIVWLLIIIGSYYTIRHEVDELYDGELAQLARVLLTLYASDDVESRARNSGTIVTSPPFEGSENYEHKLLFQVWGNNKTLLVRSSNAPESPIAMKLAQDQLNQYDTLELYGNKIRVFTLWVSQVPFVIHVGQNLDLRREIAFEILESFYPMILLLLPILVFFIHRNITKGLKPLNDLAGEITQRSSDNLEPVNLDNVPTEVKGITASLNNLFIKLQGAFKRERQFISDAAHELRTPLAGLKAQAQIALADKSRIEKSLTRIVEGVDRTSRLANQLLSLSRLESDKVDIQVQKVNLKTIIDDVRDDLEISRQKKQIKIKPSIDESVIVRTDRDMVYVLIRNLLENAIRYSSAQTVVEINLDLHEDRPRLTVADNGHGISQESIDRIFDRFYRDINAKESGSGLGLAIVKRIAELLNIKLSIENRADKSGVIVILLF